MDARTITEIEQLIVGESIERVDGEGWETAAELHLSGDLVVRLRDKEPHDQAASFGEWYLEKGAQEAEITGIRYAESSENLPETIPSAGATLTLYAGPQKLAEGLCVAVGEYEASEITLQVERGGEIVYEAEAVRAEGR